MREFFRKRWAAKMRKWIGEKRITAMVEFFKRRWAELVNNWLLVSITALLVIFFKEVWPFPPSYNFALWQKYAIAIIIEIFFVGIIERVKLCFFKLLDKDVSIAYADFIKEFDARMINLPIRKLYDANLWQREKTNMELILQRAVLEIKEKTNKAVIEVCLGDIKNYKPVKIVATNTSPLSIWFHHVITTYFVSQTKELTQGQTAGSGLINFERFYLIKNDKLLNGIKYASEIYFDFWRAADEIHHIAGKKLYVIYKKGNDFGFPKVKGEDDDKLLFYLNKDDGIIFIRSFTTENYQIGYRDVDCSRYSEYGSFLNGLQSTTVASLAHGQTDFIERIKTQDIVAWEVR